MERIQNIILSHGIDTQSNEDEDKGFCKGLDLHSITDVISGRTQEETTTECLDKNIAISIDINYSDLGDDAIVTEELDCKVDSNNSGNILIKRDHVDNNFKLDIDSIGNTSTEESMLIQEVNAAADLGKVNNWDLLKTVRFVKLSILLI